MKIAFFYFSSLSYSHTFLLRWSSYRNVFVRHFLARVMILFYSFGFKYHFPYFIWYFFLRLISFSLQLPYDHLFSFRCLSVTHSPRSINHYTELTTHTLWESKIMELGISRNRDFDLDIYSYVSWQLIIVIFFTPLSNFLILCSLFIPLCSCTDLKRNKLLIFLAVISNDIKHFVTGIPAIVISVWACLLSQVLDGHCWEGYGDQHLVWIIIVPMIIALLVSQLCQLIDSVDCQRLTTVCTWCTCLSG